MADNKGQKRAEIFQALHKGEGFLLPNCWNGGSARIFEEAGYPAIGTTSAGIAYAMGFPDGEAVLLNEVIRITREICRVVNIPLSVDMERGYGETPREVQESVRQVLQAGAVGINLEDGNPGKNPLISPLEDQLEKIRAVADLKKELSLPFVLNARTCLYWLKAEKGADLFDAAVIRARAFMDAGADSVFIPGVMSIAEAQALVDAIPGPVNLIAQPGFTDFDRVFNAGVKRISFGSGPIRSVLAHLMELAQGGKEGSTVFGGHDFSYDRANQFFKQ